MGYEMREDEYKYIHATGSLSAMVRFLVDDLEDAVDMLGNEEHWKIGNFKITIKHAKQVMADAVESGALSAEDTK